MKLIELTWLLFLGWNRAIEYLEVKRKEDGRESSAGRRWWLFRWVQRRPSTGRRGGATCAPPTCRPRSESHRPSAVGRPHPQLRPELCAQSKPKIHQKLVKFITKLLRKRIPWNYSDYCYFYYYINSLIDQ